MHRCYAAPGDWSETGIRLTPEESHHLRNALRLRAGDEVTVFDGCGRAAVARIAEGAAPSSARSGSLKRSGDLLLTPSQVVVERPRPVSVTLIQALPKGNRMDVIVEKATELGASALWPVTSERVVAEVTACRAGARLDRWRRIAVSAAKQCGTNWLPRIEPARDFGEAVRAARELDVFFCGSLEPRARPFRDAVSFARRACAARFGILIGPEGDLTPDEYRLVREAGGVPISFGRLVLRVETAAIFALSVLAYEFSAETGEVPGCEGDRLRAKAPAAGATQSADLD